MTTEKKETPVNETLEKMRTDAQWEVEYHTKKLREFKEILKVLNKI